MQRSYLKYLAQYGPAIAVLPVLMTPLPLAYLDRNEIAAYFQSLALARTGLESYTFLTPLETFSGLHLYSMLAAPLVGSGFTEGGRVVSFLAALAAATLTGYIARGFFDSDTALVAPVFLWLHPFFIRHSYTFMYVMFSIAVTVAAVAAMLAYRRTNKQTFYWLSLLALVAGVANHLWEATIALPIVVLLVSARDYRHAAGAVVTMLTSTIIVYVLMGLQPQGPSMLFQYGIQTTGISIFFTPEWWMKGGYPPFDLSLTLTPILSIISSIGWGVHYYRKRNETALILSSWFVSGLAIPFFLPGGYPGHPYYIWGLIAPLAVTAAQLTVWVTRKITASLAVKINQEAAVNVIAVGLVCVALSYGVAAETTESPVKEANGLHVEDTVAAGHTLAEMEAVPEETVFVGDWSEPYHESDIYRVVIYSDMVVRERYLVHEGGIRIQADGVKQCPTVFVRRAGDSITVAKRSHC